MKSFLVQDEWARQPPVPLPPNRANPATQDLKLLLMPGLSDDSPGLLECTGTDVTRSLGAQGQFGSFNGSTSRIDVGTTLMVNARTTVMVGAICDNPGGINFRYLFGGNYTPSGPELEAITLRTYNGNLEGGMYEIPGDGVIASLTAPSDGSYNTFFLLAGSGNSSDTWTVGYLPSNGVEASATSGAYAPGASRSGYRAWVGSGANNGSPWRFYAKPILWVGVWHRWLRAEERANIARQPWRLAAPYPRRVYFDFGASGTTITGAGNIASAEAFGSATVVPGAVTVTPTGIASAEAFGTAQINQTISGAGNIASAEAFGSSTVVPGVVTITGAGDIASAEAFGDAAVSAGGSFITGAGNIASGEVFGSATVLPGTVTITGAGGIVSAEAFGSAALGLYLLGAGGIVSAEAFGSAAVQLGTLTITGAGNIASGEAFGDALIPGGASYILGAGNIASGEAFGPVPLIPQNYTPTARILEVPGGDRVLEVPA